MFFSDNISKMIFILFYVICFCNDLCHSWDLKAPAEKYWHMRKLGLKEGHEVPHELSPSSSSSSPSSSSSLHASHVAPDSMYYNYHHMTPAYPSQLPSQAYVNHNNRISFFEKVDRSITGSQARNNPAGCSYKGRKYSHTEEVYTSQPCLNCTCQRGFVSCFLRVCPVLDPPENDDTCYLLKEPGNCCSTLKCSGLHDPSSPEQPEAASLESHSTTSTSPGYKNFGWNGGNGIERKAETVYRRTTSVRPPYNDYWGASRRISSTKAPQTSKPYARATSRPTLRSPATAKPLSHNRNFPLKPTFPPRRPMYPPAPSSNGPTNNYNRRPSTTGSTSTRKPSTTLSTNRRTPVSSITSSLNAHKDTPVREDPAINENDSDNFFRMSHLLV